MRRALLWILLVAASWAAARELLLAQEFVDQDIRGFAMSEKLDGVRAFWDGRQLISRGGYPFTPPADFLQDFPPFALDGELFSQRGAFARISAAVRATDGDWSGIALHVFDVPDAEGDLYARLAQLDAWLEAHPTARIVRIPQYPVAGREDALRFLAEVEALGGEGVMLRNPALPYHGGRSAQLLKLKSAHDAECTVIAHHPGKGRLQGMMGALSCRNERGIFRIGSGFSDADRIAPPPLGSTITYRYRGLTENGVPRFPTFLRRRDDGL